MVLRVSRRLLIRKIEGSNLAANLFSVNDLDARRRRIGNENEGAPARTDSILRLKWE